MHKCFFSDTCFCKKNKSKKQKLQPTQKSIKNYKNKSLTTERNKND